MRLIFLDIDGVLNGHHYKRDAQSCNILSPCVRQLNRIIRATEAKIVLSSAWRYMIHGKAMTLAGFGYMLRTHGMIGAGKTIIDTTIRDEICPLCLHNHRSYGKIARCQVTGTPICRKCRSFMTRGRQISHWLSRARSSGEYDVRSYVVLDDEDYGISEELHPFVQTNAACGLTAGKATRAIQLLMG